MFSPDDARLIERDRELPGLRTVLDPDAFVKWLRHHWRDAGIQAARPQYVRYKPGTSCLVTYAVEWSGGSVLVTGKAYRPPAWDKLAKVARLREHQTPIGPAAVLSQEKALAATMFPHDVKLRALRHLLGPTPRGVLDALLPGGREAPRLDVLSYKPERRAVVRLEGSGQTVVVRVYSEQEFASGAGRHILGQSVGVRLAQTLGSHAGHRVTATEWLDGEHGTTAFADADRAAAIGAALARLHSEPCIAASARSADDERRQLRAVARGLADLMPRHAARLEHLSGALGDRLKSVAIGPVLTHGDFAARQVVFTPDGVALTDLDQVAGDHPARDLGSFLADIEYRSISGEIDRETAERTTSAFMDGYARIRPLPCGTEAYRAAGLLRLAPLPFRARVPDWLTRMERIVTQCESLPWWQAPVARTGACASRSAGAAGSAENPDRVDLTMPWLSAALDPLYVSRLFADLPWGHAGTVVQSARIRRHRRGRRCLVEYDVTGSTHPTIFGKTRARGLDVRTARLNEALRVCGFGDGSADGIEVPPFLGVLPPLRMWLQAAVRGESAGEALSRGDWRVALRLAEMIVKLQRRGPLPGRTHTIADELRILDDRLEALAGRRPYWRGRLARLFDGCRSLAAALPDVPLVPAHRDFYPEQILVSGARLVLLDLDLYALAHPALDAGNCIAHVLEHGVRPGGNRGTLEEMAAVMRDAMARAQPVEIAAAVDAFTTLTLARLVAVDDRLEQRRVCVEPLLDLCEKRLSDVQRLRPRRPVVALLGPA